MILLLQSYPAANDAVRRHWPYYFWSDCDELVGIGTTCGNCTWPEGTKSVNIGRNCYIDGAHLPMRLIETLEYGLTTDHEHLLIAEYDTLFFHPIEVKRMEHGMAAHLAGGKPWGLACNKFYHNPWLIRREVAKKIVVDGRQLLAEGEVTGGSPDCWIGHLTERFGIPVQTDLWRQFSRNSLDIPHDLELARACYRNGIDVIHGVKTQEQLEFILK